MSIGFLFTASATNIAALRPVLEKLAEPCGYALDMDDQNAGLHFCQLGGVFFENTEEGISCSAQTSLAGPGFHAAAIDFVDAFVKETGLSIEMEDETEYYSHRDFSRMREEHFHSWLKNLIHVLRQDSMRDYHAVRIAWSLDGYVPEDEDGQVITPMGRYQLDELDKWVEQAGPAPFAKEYYIWYERERDARFYRNTALYRMWNDCWFMPGVRSDNDERINQQIIDLLERASVDRTLPFPKKEYLLLCELNDHEPMDLEALPDYNLFSSIGYRRGVIFENMGNLSVAIPGSFQYDYDEERHASVYFDDAEDNWHTVWISAYGGPDKKDFSETLFENTAEPYRDFTLPWGMGRMAYAGATGNEDEDYYQVVAQILTEKQVTLFTFCFQYEQEKDWAFSLLEKCHAMKPKEEE